MTVLTQELPTERKFDRFAEEDIPEDFHDLLFELEAEGELIVQRVPEPYLEVMTKYAASFFTMMRAPSYSTKSASWRSITPHELRTRYFAKT